MSDTNELANDLAEVLDRFVSLKAADIAADIAGLHQALETISRTIKAQNDIAETLRRRVAEIDARLEAVENQPPAVEPPPVEPPPVKPRPALGIPGTTWVARNATKPLAGGQLPFTEPYFPDRNRHNSWEDDGRHVAAWARYAADLYLTKGEEPSAALKDRIALYFDLDPIKSMTLNVGQRFAATQVIPALGLAAQDMGLRFAGQDKWAEHIVELLNLSSGTGFALNHNYRASTLLTLAGCARGPADIAELQKWTSMHLRTSFPHPDGHVNKTEQDRDTSISHELLEIVALLATVVWLRNRNSPVDADAETLLKARIKAMWPHYMKFMAGAQNVRMDYAIGGVKRTDSRKNRTDTGQGPTLELAQAMYGRELGLSPLPARYVGLTSSFAWMGRVPA